jgi:hypothetical protein
MQRILILPHVIVSLLVSAPLRAVVRQGACSSQQPSVLVNVDNRSGLQVKGGPASTVDN